MRKLFSTCTALLSLATMRSLELHRVAERRSHYADESQKVIAGAADRFTGTVRIQSLFDAKNHPGRAVARLLSSPERDQLAQPSAWPRS